MQRRNSSRTRGREKISRTAFGAVASETRAHISNTMALGRENQPGLVNPALIVNPSGLPLRARTHFNDDYELFSCARFQFDRFVSHGREPSLCCARFCFVLPHIA